MSRAACFALNALSNNFYFTPISASKTHVNPASLMARDQN